MRNNKPTMGNLVYMGGKVAQLWFKDKLGDAFGWACVAASVGLPIVVFGAVILSAISP